MYENRRIYRRTVNREDLVFFSVSYKDTEVYIGASQDLSRDALFCIRGLRQELDDYIKKDESFYKSLEPVEPRAFAPPIARDMCEAAKKTGVGPMASVAGAFSQYLGKSLLQRSPEILVENGGDIFLSSARERTIAVYAGRSPLSMRIGIKVPPGSTLGICTSAGTLGHSLSFGKADAAMVMAIDALLADAAATALGNALKTPCDIPGSLKDICKIKGVWGALAIMGEHLGAAGDMELVELD